MGRHLKEGVGTVWVRAQDGSDMVAFAEGDDIPKWAAEQMGAHCFEKGSAESEPDAGEFDVETANKPGLEAEIARRNEGRDDEHKIVAEAPGNKAELVAAIKADDAAAGA